MKLVSIVHSGFPAAAVLRERPNGVPRVLPIKTAPDETHTTVLVSMNDILDDWLYWRVRLHDIVDKAANEEWKSLDDVEIIAPVPHPRSLTCVGLNYRDHAEETGAAIPLEPVIFAKHPSSIVGNNSQIDLPSASSEVDYEAELAIVIGLPVFRADAQEALAAVAGYTIMNDVSARDWQGRSSQWMPAKSFPTFGPMGPALVTVDELGDASGLRISLTVNGRTLQDSSTDQLIFNVGEVISYISQVWPLGPGDVIATGTPAGVGFTRTPPIYLRDGDVVEATIEGIGMLRNTVAAASPALKEIPA